MEEVNIYDTVEIEDMEYNLEKKTFLYQCPCGDKFRAEVPFLKEEHDKFPDKGYAIVKCPSCSLRLKVIYDMNFLSKYL